MPDDRIGFYLHVLDRVLKDRVVDEREAEELRQLAHEWELTQADARRAHEIYLGMLVATALDDRHLTNAERRDLERVADLLGISCRGHRTDDPRRRPTGRDRLTRSEPRGTRTV